MNSIVCNLDGYLLALRRLSRNKCDFWASTFELVGDIEQSLAKHLEGHEIEVSLSDKSVESYSDIDDILQQHVFSNLIINDDNLLKLFAWDITEFIEMTYRLIEPKINPIINGEALVFNARSDFHGEYIYLVIPVEKQAIIVGLAARA